MSDRLGSIDDAAWQPLPGFPGIDVLPLGGTLDEAAKTGRRTRLVRLAPGACTDRPLMHDYHEEAMLIAGDLRGLAGGASTGEYDGLAYVHRPPGTPHGPIASTGGCILLEIQYYA